MKFYHKFFISKDRFFINYSISLRDITLFIINVVERTSIIVFELLLAPKDGPVRH